jgi:hypothetical protein
MSSKERLLMRSPTTDVFSGLYRGAGLLAIVGTLGCGSIVDRFSGRREACEIISIGKPATGRVLRLIDTGTTINNDPVVEFVLEVTPPDGKPYEAHTKGLVSRLDIPAVQPGRVFPVKYDPQNPARVALDIWGCPKK